MRSELFAAMGAHNFVRYWARFSTKTTFVKNCVRHVGDVGNVGNVGDVGDVGRVDDVGHVITLNEYPKGHKFLGWLSYSVFQQ